MKYYHKIEKFICDYKAVIIILTTFPLGYYIQSLNGRVSMNVNNYKNIYYFLSSSIITIMSIVIFVNIFIKKDKFFNKIGIMSLFYLGYHGFIMAPLKSFAPDILTNDILTFLVALITYLIMFYPSKFVYKKIPILIGKFKGETV